MTASPNEGEESSRLSTASQGQDGGRHGRGAAGRGTGGPEQAAGLVSPLQRQFGEMEGFTGSFK